MNHEPMTTLAELAAQAATRFSDVEANAGLVREEFLTLALQAHNDAALTDEIPTEHELLGEWLAKSLDTSAKRRQASLKKALVGFQSVFDFGTDYDSVVLVCGAKTLGATAGRITTLGMFSADDLVLMDNESRSNMEKIVKAHERQHDGVIRALPTLRQFSNYRAFRQMSESA